MSPEAKRLKLTGLVTMFGGLGVLIWAIVCAFLSPDLTDALQAIAGGGGMYLGAQGARLANVPSAAERIIDPAFIGFFVAAGLFAAGYILVSPPSFPQLIGIVVVAFLVLLVAIFAKAIAEALKRK